MKKQWSKSNRGQEQRPNPNPNREPALGNRDAMASVLHDSLETSSTEIYFVMKLKQKYSTLIIGIAIFVPLLFVAILTYHIFWGDFFLDGGAVPKAVFVSGTMLCFIAVYGVLITSVFQRASDLPKGSRQSIHEAIMRQADLRNNSDM